MIPTLDLAIYLNMVLTLWTPSWPGSSTFGNAKAMAAVLLSSTLTMKVR